MCIACWVPACSNPSIEPASNASFRSEGFRAGAKSIVYRGLRLRCAYRLDLLVADRLVVELKAVEAILPIHHAQLLSYLRLTGHRLGLLINFNSPTLSRGIKRLVND